MKVLRQLEMHQPTIFRGINELMYHLGKRASFLL